MGIAEVLAVFGRLETINLGGGWVMCNNELIELYKQAYESGSHDLRSLNRYLKELNVGVKLVVKNGLIKVEAA